MSPGDRRVSHLCVWVVAAPVWPDAGLSTQVPDLELDILVRHSLHIETDGCRAESLSDLELEARPLEFARTDRYAVPDQTLLGNCTTTLAKELSPHPCLSIF